MAGNVHNRFGASVAAPRGLPPRRMKSDFQIRFTAGLLILLTTAAFVLAWINFQKEPDYQLATDGVWWMEKDGALVARRVDSNGPGAQGGIQPGDRLAAINFREVKDSVGKDRQIARAGVWSKVTYSLVRQSVPVDMKVILVPSDR